MLSLLMQGALVAGVFHVSPDGSPGGSGVSWAEACSSLQRAIDLAGAGDEIRVRQGVYVPEKLRPTAASADPGASFLLKDGVSILGGFAGDEASPEQRRRRDLDGNGIVETWEYAAETVLQGHEALPGPVVTSGPAPLAQATLLEGLTIRQGDVSRRNSAPCGGGAWLDGAVTVRNCRILGNRAQQGGGLYLKDDVRVTHCLVSGNTLDNSCWNSRGGGVFLEGSNNVLSYCVISRNGDAALGGGGVYSQGANRIRHCVLAANRSLRHGSAARLEDRNSSLTNSLVWMNTPRQTQIYPIDARIEHNACTQHVPGNICLQEENAGPDGIDANDNLPERSYACLASPERGDYSLGRGSYLINRGVPDPAAQDEATDCAGRPALQCGHPDIGGYEAGTPGNLGLDFHLAAPVACGDRGELVCQVPEDQLPFCDVRLQEAPPAGRGPGRVLSPGNILEGTAAGDVRISGEAVLAEEEAANWNPLVREKDYLVRKRDILLQGDSLVWEDDYLPELTWTVLRGSLLEGDRIEGAPELTARPLQPGTYPFGIGSLAIAPEASRSNYDLVFLPGQLECRRGAKVRILLDDLEQTYSASPRRPRVSTIPEGFPVDLTFEGVGGTGHPGGAAPPVDAGRYLVRAALAESHCTGEATAEFTVSPAVLTCIADDQTKDYLAPVPPLTVTFRGYFEPEPPTLLEPLEITTDATAASPPDDQGYEIRVSGGRARNYTLEHVPGRLHVRRLVPRVNRILAGVCTYGTPMKNILLMGYALHPATGDYLPGEFRWDDPERILPAGDLEDAWTFVPDEPEFFEEVHGTACIYVARREIAIRALPRAKTYGDPDPPLTFEVTAGAFAPQDRFPHLLGRIPGEDKGDYSILLDTGNDLSDYEVSFQQNFLTIGAREITVAAHDRSKFVDAADPELTYHVSKGEILPGDRLEGALRRRPGETVGTYEILQGTLSASANYRLSFIPGTLSILHPDLTADLQLPEIPLAYGDSLAQVTPEVTVRRPDTGEAVPGTFAWDDPDQPLLPGHHEIPWTFTPDDQERYTVLSGTQPVDIPKALLQVVFPHPYAREYLQDNPEFSYGLTGFVLDDTAESLLERPAILCEAGRLSAPGTYEVVTSGGRDPRYDFVQGRTELAVRQGTPRPEDPGSSPESFLAVVNSASGAPEPVLTYGEPLRTLELSADFLDGSEPPQPIPGVLTWDEGEAVLPAGDSEQAWTFVPDSPNYGPVTGVLQVTVRKAPLTISIADRTVEKGTPLPEFVPEYRGFVGGETPQVLTALPTVRCAAADTQTLGDFAVTPSGGEAANYEIRHVPGVLTVDRIALAARELPGLDLVYGTPLADLDLRGSAVRQRDGVTVAGTYRWLDSALVPDRGTHLLEWEFLPDRDPGDYRPLRGTHRITVEARELHVQADPQTQVFGDPAKPLTYRVQEAGTIPDGVLVGGLSRAPGEDVGGYDILPGTLRCSDNYRLVFSGAVYSITRRPLHVTVSPAGKTYGDAEPAFECRAVDPALQAQLSGAAVRSPGEHAGEHPFSLQGLRAGANYQLFLDTASFTIRRRPVTIAADSLEKTYGLPDPALTWRIAEGGIVPGDGSTGALARRPGEMPGEYRIDAGTFGLPDDYELTFVPGVLRIVPAALAVAGTVPPQAAAAGQRLAEVPLAFRIVHAATGESVPGRLAWKDGTERVVLGARSYEWAFLPDVPEAYQPCEGTAEITAEKSLLMAHLAQGYTRGYHSENPEFTYTLTGFLEGDGPDDLQALPTVQCDAGPDSPVGTYLVRTAGGEDETYAFQQATANLEVLPLAPASAGGGEEAPAPGITHALTGEPQPVLTYGEPLDTLRLSADFFDDSEPPQPLPGVLTWDQGDSIPGAGVSHQGWTFVPDSPNFAPVTGVLDVTVRKAPLTISVADHTVERGMPLPEFVPEYEGFVGGETPDVLTTRPKVVCAAKNTAHAGVFTVAPSGAKAANYEITYRSGTLTITRLALLAGEGLPAVVEPYGKTLSQMDIPGQATCERDGTPVPGVYKWRNGSLKPDCGTHLLEWDFVPDSDPGDYLPLAGTHEITIVVRDIHVNARSIRQTYGEPEKELTYEVVEAQWVEAGQFTGSLVRESGADVGDYQILQGTLRLPSNYNLIFQGALYTIDPARVVCYASPRQKHYGEPDPDIRCIVRDTGEPCGLDYTIGRAEGETVGKYRMSFKKKPANYDIELENWDFEILAQRITVSLDKLRKYYAAPDPEITWTVTQGSYLVPETPTGKPYREAGETVGTRTLGPGTLQFSNNYIVKFVNGTLTIVKAKVDVIFREEPYVYDDHTKLLETDCNVTPVHIVTRNPVTGVFKWDNENDTVKLGDNYYTWKFTPNSPAYEVATGEHLITGTPYEPPSGGGQVIWPWDRSTRSTAPRAAAPRATAPRAQAPAAGQTRPSRPAAAAAASDTVSGVGSPGFQVTHGVTGSHAFRLTYGEPLRILAPRHDLQAAGGQGRRIEGSTVWEDPDLVPAPGTHIVDWRFTPDSPELPPVGGSQEISVSRAPLVVRAGCYRVEKGMPLPEIRFECLGLVGEDTPEVLKTAVACRDELRTDTPGTFPIVPTPTEADDYIVSYQPGELVVDPIALLPNEKLPVPQGLRWPPPPELALRGHAVCRRNGRRIPGTYRWRTPDGLTGPGLHPMAWEFQADTAPSDYQPLRGVRPVRILSGDVPETARSQRGGGRAGTAAEIRQTDDIETGAPIGDGKGAGPGLVVRDVRCSPIEYGQPVRASRLTGRVLRDGRTASPEGGFSWLHPDAVLEPGVYRQAWRYSDRDPAQGGCSGITRLLVRPRRVRLTVPSCSKACGDEDPELSCRIDPADFAGVPPEITGSLAREPGETLGTYRILPGSLSLGPGYRPEMPDSRLRILADDITVNPEWRDRYRPGEEFTWNHRRLAYLRNAAADLALALECCRPGGTVRLAPGEHPVSGELVVDKGVTLQAETPAGATIPAPLRICSPGPHRVVLRDLELRCPAGGAGEAGAVLTIGGGSRGILLERVAVAAEDAGALRICGASGVEAEGCSFTSRGRPAVAIEPGETEGLNQDLAFRRCTFAADPADADGTTPPLLKLADGLVNSRQDGILPMLDCVFRKTRPAAGWPEERARALVREITGQDPDTPDTPAAGIRLLAKPIRCTLERESPLDRRFHILDFRKEDLPARPEDCRFLVRLLDGQGRTVDRQAGSPDRRSRLRLATGDLTVGDYRLQVSLLSPRTPGTWRPVRCSEELLARTEPPVVDGISLRTDPDVSRDIVVGTPIELSATARYGRHAWDITAAVIDQCRTPDLAPACVDGRHYLLPTAAGDHRLRIVHRNGKADLSIHCVPGENTYYQPRKPLEGLTRGTCQEFAYDFFDRYGNRTDDRIVSVECSDPEHCFAQGNHLLVGLDAPLRRTTVTLVTARNFRIPLELDVLSPGGSWCLDWHLEAFPSPEDGGGRPGLELRPVLAPGVLRPEAPEAGGAATVLSGPRYLLERLPGQGLLPPTYRLRPPEGEGDPDEGDSIRILPPGPDGDSHSGPGPGGYAVVQDGQEKTVCGFPGDPVVVVANLTGKGPRFFYVRKSRLEHHRRHGLRTE